MGSYNTLTSLIYLRVLKYCNGCFGVIKKCFLLFLLHRYAPDAHAPSWSSWHGAAASCSPRIKSITDTATTWHAPTPAYGHATQSTVWTSHG